MNTITLDRGSGATGVNTIISHKTAARTETHRERCEASGPCSPHTTTREIVSQQVEYVDRIKKEESERRGLLSDGHVGWVANASETNNEHGSCFCATQEEQLRHEQEQLSFSAFYCHRTRTITTASQILSNEINKTIIYEYIHMQKDES